MKKTILLSTLAIAALFCAVPLHAQTIKTWTGGDGDFFNDANWDVGSIPGLDLLDIAVINNGSTATINADAGVRTFGGIRLGDVDGGTESGHIIMEGGRLVIGSTPGDPNQVLIGLSAELSTFIMNGGEIYLDAPDTGLLDSNFKGANEIDWEVGLRGLGHFEMHGDSVFYASDDLKVAENALGSGSVIIDGNARVGVGSGISISSGGDNEQTMVIGGNARVDSGNSMGAGNPLGGSDEGYLTMAIGGGRALLTIQDDAVLNIRRLTAREGTSTIIVKNRGQFHIFDVLNGTGTDAASRPPELGPNSAYGSAGTSDATLILQDDAQMTVNSAPESGPTRGLGISAQRDFGNPAGTARLVIQDRATLRIEQDLMLGTGASAESSDGTLEVVGPDANVSIGGNLNMAVDLDGIIAGMDEFGSPLPGKSTLSTVITAAQHTTVEVDGIARIGEGRLKVTTSGFSPVAGASYTLIQGGTIEGEFSETDFSEATLAAGLDWQVEYSQDSVRLNVIEQGAGGRILTVTTANNVNPPAGSLSLLQAITDLQDGDTIQFNIPGNGPHFIETPSGGYPLITAHNVTIDGYSQPGSSPNTNPILAANNANIQIVLDSRNGNVRLMDFDPDVSSSGYGDTEAAVIGIYEATNIHISGISILAVPLLPQGSPNFEDVGVYGISFARGASGHISGNWIGIAPDGTTLAGPADGVTGFRYRVTSDDPYVMNDNVIIGVAPGSTNAPAEFNVFCGIPAIPVILEASGTRISGNFFNVFPNGLQDFNPPLAEPELFFGTFEGNIEIGRSGNNTLIGVDGDGVNDENERNIFSGALPGSQGGYNHNIEFYGQSPGTNIVIAGNYFGLGVDGTTRFTNGVPALNASGGSAQFRFGSDLDGVSDDLEGNVVFNNWPPDLFPTFGHEGFFDSLSTGGIVGARGNVFVNNFPFPVSPQNNAGLFWIDYYTKALVDPNLGVVPMLSSETTATRLIGTAPLSNEDYPVTMIDLYIADPEGIEYGQTAFVPELPNGYVQGRIFVGSFVDNSPADANPAAGEFDFDISNLELPGTNLTITANYSPSPAGTPNAIVLTSPFSDPIGVDAAPPRILLSVDGVSPASLQLSWTGGTGPFLLQKKATFQDAEWMNVLTTPERSAIVPNDGTTGFFRVSGGATITVIPLSAYMAAIFERPNTNSSTATGVGTFSIEGDTLSYDIAYRGLTGPANNAHIHGYGTTEDSRGVVIGFDGPFGVSGRIAGSATLTEEQRTNILAGRTYANIHTVANGGGEIRGQIAKLNLTATLNGANERPDPVDTPATGTGNFTLVGNELFVDVSYSGLQGTASNAHIHGPATADEPAGVLVGMNDLHIGPFGTSGQFQGSVILSPENLSRIIDGLTYFNIHSSAYGGGEIRGQIVP